MSAASPANVRYVTAHYLLSAPDRYVSRERLRAHVRQQVPNTGQIKRRWHGEKHGHSVRSRRAESLQVVLVELERKGAIKRHGPDTIEVLDKTLLQAVKPPQVQRF